MILVKTIVREYYRQNVAFYLMILFFCFGLLSGREHFQMIQVIMSRPSLLIFASFAWLLHVLKSLQFIHFTLKEPEYAFLQDFTLLPSWQQLYEITVCMVLTNAPFLIYGLAMILLGLQLGHSLAALIVLGIFIILLIPATFLFRYRLFHFHTLTGITFQKYFINLPEGRNFFFLRHLLNSKPLLLISSKIYSAFFIIGGAKLFFTDAYDFRLLCLCLFLSGIGLFPLGQEIVNFQSVKLSFERNFPVSVEKIFSQRLAGATILLIPELILIGYHWFDKVQLFHIADGLLFLITIMTFWSVYYLTDVSRNEDHIFRLFYVAAVIFVLIMFKVPLLVFSLLLLLLSWRILKKNYFNFEPLDAGNK